MRCLSSRTTAVSRRGSYVADDVDVQNGGSYHFLRSDVDLKVSYKDAAGGPLRGIGPVRLSSSDATANAQLSGTKIYVGSTPNQITLASPAAPSTHTVHAVDAMAVTTIADVTPKPRGADVLCVEPSPRTATNQRIYGTSPTRTRISVSGGDGCGIVGGYVEWAAISTGRNELCAAPVPGRPNAAITINWGNATSTWQCRANP